MMTTETYERTRLVITSFDKEDVITTSGEPPQNDEYEIIIDR